MRNFISRLMYVGAVVGLLSGCDDSDYTTLYLDFGLDPDSGPASTPDLSTEAEPPPTDAGPPPTPVDGSVPVFAATLALNSPANNATVTLPATKKVTVTFTTNYTLMPSGKCAAKPNCGHIYVLVDGASCNVMGKTYNTLASASPTSADLSKCATPTGMHTISLELRTDSGIKVTGPGGMAITAQAQITAQ